MGCIHTVPEANSSDNLGASSPQQDISHATLKGTEPFIPSFQVCKVLSVYDGDTITIAGVVDEKVYKFSVRMLGYDSPEMKSKNPLEKEAAIRARDALRCRVLDRIVSIEISPKREKFGRLLATISDEKGPINEWMVSQGYGYRYNGGTKEVFRENLLE